jgi:hypothetical protein
MASSTALPERILTFVVRIVQSPAGVHAVIERVKTGRKQRVESIEGISHAIAVMSREDEGR